MNISILNGNSNRIIERLTNNYMLIDFSMQHRVNVRIVKNVI